MESKDIEFAESESRTVVVKGKEVGENMEMLVKRYKLSVKSQALRYSMVTTINNTVFYA